MQNEAFILIGETVIHFLFLSLKIRFKAQIFSFLKFFFLGLEGGWRLIDFFS